jgi:formylglycine-generating enzyme required for sulfatase activity
MKSLLASLPLIVSHGYAAAQADAMPIRSFAIDTTEVSIALFARFAQATGFVSDAENAGGSWWYGAAQMHRDHLQTKPFDTAVVYIDFRCARSL